MDGPILPVWQARGMALCVAGVGCWLLCEPGMRTQSRAGHISVWQTEQIVQAKFK